MRTVHYLLSVAFAAVLAASCTSEPHVLDVCEDACTRALSCGTITDGDFGSCRARCGSDVNPESQCSNESAMVDCQDDCLSQSTCASYESCVAACPACEAPPAGAER